MDGIINETMDLWQRLAGWRDVLQVFAVVFAVLLANFVAKRTLARLLRAAESSESIWDDAFLHAAGRPLRLLIWVLGLALAIKLALLDVGSELVGLVDAVRDLGVIAALTWFLMRVVSQVERNVLRRDQGTESDRIDRTTADAIAKLLRASIVITGALIAMQTLGFSISGVLAFGGVGGIAVGFAGRDLLANFFGGLTVYLDRPFVVGDWIRSPDREIEGTVEHIGWRSTRIRTFDKRPLFVPNAVFTTIVVENPSRMLNRRIYETLGVRYDDMTSVAGITEEVYAMLQEHPDIDSDRTLMVNLNAFGASSLDFFIYCFTHTTEWERFHQIKQDVLLRIAAIVEARGADFAFPTQTLHLPEVVRITEAAADG
jgi:MscS family membrane protein